MAICARLILTGLGWIMLFGLVLSACAPSETEGRGVVDLQGRRIDPFSNPEAVATVLIFARSDCPISNRYAPEIRRIHQRFAPAGFEFWLVFPDSQQHLEEIREHVEEFNLTLPALRDSRHELVRRVDAQITPEAAVIRKGELIYRGRIDDRFAAFGQDRRQPTRRDLHDVLSQLQQGKSLQFRTEPAVGCYISDLK